MNMSMNNLNSIFLIFPLLLIWILMFSLNQTPMMIMIMLILFSLSIALNMTKFSSSSQLSFLLFLMMTSGILILFTFFISMISNETIYYKPMYLMIFLLTTLIYFYLNNSITLMNFHNNLNYMNIENKMNYINNFKLILIYSKPFIFIIFLLLSYLMIHLTFITKICLNMNKPMQSTFN